MSNRSTRGFTLIEILAVVAIIGVLSAVVLTSLNNARNKGNDAATKSNLAQARTQAELFFHSTSNNSYDGGTAATDVCNASGNVGGIKGVNTAVKTAAQAQGLTTVVVDNTGATNAATCNSTTDKWAAEVPLKNGPVNSMFCVDSSGFAGTTTGSTLGSAADYACN